MADIKMEAEIIFDSHVPNALRRALEYAGDDGFVASMPQLLHARCKRALRQHHLEHLVHLEYTEESVVTTPQGNHVIVVVHGGGIYASPETVREDLPGECGPQQSRGLYRAILRQDLPEGSQRCSERQVARWHRDPDLPVR